MSVGTCSSCGQPNLSLTISSFEDGDIALGAASRGRRFLIIVQLLIDRGVDFNLKGKVCLFILALCYNTVNNVYPSNVEFRSCCLLSSPVLGVCMCAHVSVHACFCACMRAGVCVWVQVCASVCVGGWVGMCVRTCVYVCMGSCVCVSVLYCVYAIMHVYDLLPCMSRSSVSRSIVQVASQIYQ